MKVLDKKLLRNLWTAKGQAIAVTMVILCGVASFVCVLSAHRSLRLTRDTYYQRYRFADFWAPLERAPRRVVKKVEALPGVLRAQGRIVKEVNLDVEGKREPCTGRLISLPQQAGVAINDIHLISGRYFSLGVLNEVILSDRFARENRLSVGDRIWATMNDRKQPLRIVGTALSPEYVYMIRSAREFLPNPDRFAILWVTRDFAEMALGMQAAVNEIIGFLDPAVNVEALLARIEDTLEPYGVLTTFHRADQLSNRYLSEEIKGLGVSARIIPAIFLGIAALILMAMLERIVHRERTQLGVLKAYGYSNFAIGSHYIKFSLALSLVGAFGGVLLGNWLARGLMGMYVQFFEFPILRHRFYPDVLVLTLVISMLAGVLGASWAVAGVVKIQPAQALRPPAPRAGHRIWLEGVGVLWRHVSFIGKMVLRNIFRYKLRAALTVFGVMCATVILLFARLAGDCMDYLITYQFDTVQKQDARVDFYVERGRGALLEARRFPQVRAAEPQLNYPFTLKSGWRKMDVVVTGVAPSGEMLNLETSDGHPIKVGEGGLVIDHYVAGKLCLHPGDTLIMKPLLGKVMGETPVRVRAVAEQYLGTGTYMNIRALSHLLDESFAVNAVLLRVEQGGYQVLNRYLKDVPAVASVEFKHESRQKVEETLEASMAINNLFMGIFAGVIAFAIIYNTTAISLTEWTRELASLRVLGFSLSEIRRIVFGENVLLAAAGVVLGIPLGTLLCRWLVTAYETDIYRLPFYLSRGTFVITAVGIGVFVFIANLASRRRIAQLDMVEVLKVRE